MSSFARTLLAWRRRHGRRGMPWQGTRDPYRIWVSEIMLQQTRVAAVVPYYERFVARFPDVFALAAAPRGEVLKLWSGLGYYARARHLHEAARRLVSERDGKFPRTVEALAALPGIGRSSAGAIAALAFGARAAILEGNVRRVLARAFGVENTKAQWALAERLLPSRRIEAYTQALMDLGATVCTRRHPACERCPLAPRCFARKEGRIEELPSPKRRGKTPLRAATWLVLRHNGRVLLERRPPSGIWGGLWTFPQAEDRGGASRFGCELAAVKALPVFEHVFSHFRLRVRPLLCEVRRVAPRAGQPGRLWIDVEEAVHAAVPAPVRKLLAALATRRA